MENTNYVSVIKGEEQGEAEEEEEGEAISIPSKVFHPQVVAVTGAPPRIHKQEEPEAIPLPKQLPVIQEVINTLPPLDMLRISAVLEDTLDQLSILNYIMPAPFERKRESIHKSSRDMNIVVQNLDRLQTSIMQQRKSSTAAELEGAKLIHRAQPEKHEDKTEDFIAKRPARQTILTLENLSKVQSDREEMKRKQIKSLQKELQNVKNERQVETQGRNEYIANLRDQLQELKAKTNMESRYVKKNTDLQIAQTQKKCSKNEEALLEEIDRLRFKTDEEIRVHLEIESFLKKEQQKLEEKLEYWMEKYDKDTEMKQNELNSLKSAKASDLAALQDLAKQLREFEQVIIEDRLEKEKARKKIEQDALELKSIIKLQAWWRGTMIRRELGNFKMPKKEKDDGKGVKGKGKKPAQKRR
ncbi:dynein regulatory complex protein 9 isoform X2 [Petaurus breviceps papuanus]|uniref:dynein regulatory complex protein 9 isoform X2 n=1 Tax=Petaurus breviceps papuanus TaxID=3040969 RepID=UPI0036DDFED4